MAFALAPFVLAVASVSVLLDRTDGEVDKGRPVCLSPSEGILVWRVLPLSFRIWADIEFHWRYRERMTVVTMSQLALMHARLTPPITVVLDDVW